MARQRIINLTLMLAAILVLGGCSTSLSEANISARALYQNAALYEAQNLNSEAIKEFKKVVEQHRGSSLGSYAHLRMANIHAKGGNWDDAVIEYRLFRATSGSEYMSSEVLYRMLETNFKLFEADIWFGPAYERGVEPLVEIIEVYKRFYLLYPNSIFHSYSGNIYTNSLNMLAEHELMVADFYFDGEYYAAASARYRDLFFDYPNFVSEDALSNWVYSLRRLGREDEVQYLLPLIKK